MSSFYKPIHQWNLCHILPLKCSPFLHEILDSPYLPLALFWERISLCCCVGALVVWPNQFNTGRLTKLTRRNFLWNGGLVTWQSCRRWRRKWTACGTPFLKRVQSRKSRRYGNGLRISQDSKERGERVLDHGQIKLPDFSSEIQSVVNRRGGLFSKAPKNCCDEKLNLKIVGTCSNLIVKIHYSIDLHHKVIWLAHRQRFFVLIVCPVCTGHGRIRNSFDIKVCQNCGGFGLIRNEGKTFDRKGKPISTPFQVDSRVVED